MLVLGIILTILSMVIVWRDMMAQMQGPVVDLKDDRIHTRWLIMHRNLIVALSCGSVAAMASMQKGDMDDGLSLVAIVGCGVAAAMAVVNVGTFLLNRDHQLIDIRWRSGTYRR